MLDFLLRPRLLGRNEELEEKFRHMKTCVLITFKVCFIVPPKAVSLMVLGTEVVYVLLS